MYKNKFQLHLVDLPATDVV